jgi:hypothetical protein
LELIRGREDWTSGGDDTLNLADDALAVASPWLPLATGPHDPRLNLCNSDVGWRAQPYRYGRYPLRGPIDHPWGVPAPRWKLALGSALVSMAGKMIAEVVSDPPPGAFGAAVSHAVQRLDQLRTAPREDAFQPLLGSFALSSLEDARLALGDFLSHTARDLGSAPRGLVARRAPDADERAERVAKAERRVEEGDAGPPAVAVDTTPPDLAGLGASSDPLSFGGSVLAPGA